MMPKEMKHTLQNKTLYFVQRNVIRMHERLILYSQSNLVEKNFHFIIRHDKRDFNVLLLYSISTTIMEI